MQIKKTAAVITVVGFTLAGLAISSIPANAFDPVSNGYTIVGSDTLEDAVGALVNGTSVTGTGVRTTASDSSTLGSFDATGTGTIITKPYGIRFQRPNGSGDGRAALDAQINSTPYTSSFGDRDSTYDAVSLTNTPIDIVRSSSGGTAASGTSGLLARYTFGRDAIAFAYGTAVVPGTNGFISKDNMKLIYQCDTTALTAFNVDFAIVPQYGSGTRNDFSVKIGLGTKNADGTVSDPWPVTGNGSTGSGSYSCIKVGQEHDASKLAAKEIMPMSASRWIAMKNNVSYNKSGTAQLGSLVSGSSSVLNTNGVYTPVVSYYKDSTWGRDTYLFVDKRRVDSTNAKYDAVLKALFDYTDETSLTYQGNTVYGDMTAVPTFGAYTSAAVKLKFGFLPASVKDSQLLNK
jgi:hypothetical protein